MKTLFNRAELDKALVKAGLISFPRNGYLWVMRREKRGKLVCPKDPVTGFRIFTQKQIKEIVKAFSVGGKGRWKP